jgi:hypothetical protein
MKIPQVSGRDRARSLRSRSRSQKIAINRKNGVNRIAAATPGPRRRGVRAASDQPKRRRGAVDKIDEPKPTLAQRNSRAWCQPLTSATLIEMAQSGAAGNSQIAAKLGVALRLMSSGGLARAVVAMFAKLRMGDATSG